MPSYLVRLANDSDGRGRSVQTTSVDAHNLYESQSLADTLAAAIAEWLTIDTIEIVDPLGRLLSQRPIYGEWA